MADRPCKIGEQPPAIYPFASVISALAATGFLVTSCSGHPDEHFHPTETRAIAPDACTLITDSMAEMLVGEHTVTRAQKAPDSSGCSWQAPLSAHLSELNGLLNVSVVTATRRASGADEYSDAKATYHGLQDGKFCYRLTTSADKACWQKGRESITVIARQGYTVLKADYTAANSSALGENKMKSTATLLANEMLSHLHP